MMEFHYEVIAKMAADISKQMLRLNTQLDKIIDKQDELAAPDAQQAAAIALINELKWDDAAKLCVEQAKEAEKRIKLDSEEVQVRAELEALRERLVRVSNGDVETPEAAEPEADADADRAE
jgi:hypothetical protein